MNNSRNQNSGQDGSIGKMPDEAFGPVSAEDTRTLILRSRAIGEGEARLADAINATAPGDRPQSQEDAFALPPEEPVCPPAGKVGGR